MKFRMTPTLGRRFPRVVGVFGLPDAVGEGEMIDESAVGAKGGPIGWAAKLIPLNEVPVVRRAAALEEVGKGGADVAFRDVSVLLELRESGVVVLDGLVGGLQRKEAHRAKETLSR